MQQLLVITFTSADRPGIVDTLATVVRAHGANWESSRMASLAGRFAGILQVAVSPERADPLIEALQQIEGMGVLVDRGSEWIPAMNCFYMHLTGDDRPGIVREIAHALAVRGVNIEDMETETVEAPMAGGLLFQATAELRAPESVGLDELRTALEEIAQDLMVEISLAAPHDAS
jgi:glycine cleavage system regulatory protein